ncbi:VanZ like family protein [Rosistilla oblonga]|uniref:VanZ like family protein n=1 Tax=Rosistilla oblonga TaxID=2527990 RepID=A0A518INW1_9BACT|nr:VanZ family protein [Rosistilla oblonga]QDV10946.1 VanZ like family protein [Rosistilla oblonga]QDV54783.1 VanZ like family protein [Rosistilla oblonga]
MNAGPADQRGPGISRWKLVGACCALGAFFVPLPAGSQRLDQLYNFSHLLVFGGLAFMMMQVFVGWGFWRRVAFTLSSVLALGVAIELIQPFFGRRASLHDVINDLIGGVVGISIAAAFRWATLMYRPSDQS